MIKLVNILESITENQVTKGDWGKADGEQRVDWLLQIFDDADEAEKHFETEWEDLPNEARDFMKISESVNEGKDNRSHIILRVEPRNYDAMVDKLQDMNINHNQESKNTIKVYTDKTSGWYGNSKAQYKLTHDVWVDKFVIRESIHEGPLVREGKMPFSKNDWDVKWNVAKGTRKDSEAAVNARWKAIRGLMGGEHKSIRRFVKETTIWKSLTYDEFVKWYTQLLKELS